jgi:hypothetical protein
MRSLLIAELQVRSTIKNIVFLISNFRRVLNVVCFPLGNSPESEFYMSTFRNTMFHLHTAGRYEEWLGLRNVGVITGKVWLRLFSSQNVSHINTPTFSNLVILHTYPPMTMNRECSETSAHKIQTPGNYPEESIQHIQWRTKIPFTSNLCRQQKKTYFGLYVKRPIFLSDSKQISSF